MNDADRAKNPRALIETKFREELNWKEEAVFWGTARVAVGALGQPGEKKKSQGWSWKEKSLIL